MGIMTFIPGVDTYFRGILPSEFFTEIDNIKSTSYSLITSRDQFRSWCSGHCPPSLVIKYILPCREYDVSARADICIWLLRSKRCTPDQRKLISEYKSKFVRERQKIKSLIKKKRSSVHLSTVESLSKRRKLCGRDDVVESQSFPLNKDVLGIIYPYLIVARWNLREVSKTLYNSYTEVEPILVLFRDRKKKIITVKRLLLTLLSQENNVNRDQALKTIQSMKTLDYRRTIDVSYIREQYLCDIDKIADDFILEFKGMRISPHYLSGDCPSRLSSDVITYHLSDETPLTLREMTLLRSTSAFDRGIETFGLQFERVKMTRAHNIVIDASFLESIRSMRWESHRCPSVRLVFIVGSSLRYENITMKSTQQYMKENGRWILSHFPNARSFIFIERLNSQDTDVQEGKMCSIGPFKYGTMKYLNIE